MGIIANWLRDRRRRRDHNQRLGRSPIVANLYIVPAGTATQAERMAEHIRSQAAAESLFHVSYRGLDHNRFGTARILAYQLGASYDQLDAPPDEINSLIRHLWTHVAGAERTAPVAWVVVATDADIHNLFPFDTIDPGSVHAVTVTFRSPSGRIIEWDVTHEAIVTT